MANVLFDALLRGRAEEARPFVKRPSGHIISYRQFHARAAQFAHALVAHGVKPDDRVAVQVEKSTDALALYFATIGVGAVYSPLNTEYTIRELSCFVQNACPALVVCTPASARDIEPIATKVQAAIATMGNDNSGTLIDSAREMTTTFDWVARA